MTADMPWGSPAGERQPLTPDRVRKHEFTRTPLGRRGYSEDEVRAFLYRVADDMAAGDKEKADLRAYIDRMKQWYKEHGLNPEQATGSQTPSVDAINILSRAQQTADAQIAEAEDYARRIVGQARQQYEEMLTEAQRQAEEAANQAVGAYRAGDGVQSAEAEELERRIAYLRTFADVTQVQLRAVLEGLANEVGKLGHVPDQAKQFAAGSPSVYG
ncbi:DivIVA domain-containing protein [Microbispora amethystogenes]|uniref:Cell wall synthesis protein Wag31 n=2 Tax=Microbispora TaxID=2005 RepID=A0A5J5K251_9ACTN|nr:DivIVA domain-containing protein [Microbispora amethystogenes]KAA9377121.1 DivIVA domain-containing protein [Microbispora cellulosiformans]